MSGTGEQVNKHELTSKHELALKCTRATRAVLCGYKLISASCFMMHNTGTSLCSPQAHLKLKHLKTSCRTSSYFMFSTRKHRERTTCMKHLKKKTNELPLCSVVNLWRPYCAPHIHLLRKEAHMFVYLYILADKSV